MRSVRGLSGPPPGLVKGLLHLLHGAEGTLEAGGSADRGVERADHSHGKRCIRHRCATMSLPAVESDTTVPRDSPCTRAFRGGTRGPFGGHAALFIAWLAR